MEKEYDAIIVGAGPAGCSAAAFLAGKGHQVLLLEKAVFPRDKVCGDGVGPMSLTMLDKIGVFEKIESRDFHRMDSVLLSAPGGKSMTGRIPSVNGQKDFGYVIPRKELDHLVFTHTKNLPNVTAIEDVKVTGLLYAGWDSTTAFAASPTGGIKGKSFSDPDFDVSGVYSDYEEFHGKFVLVGEGAHSLAAKKLGLHNNRRNHQGFAIRAYFENVKGLTNAIELHYEPSIMPGYAWIFPVGENRANVGIGVGYRFTGAKDIRKMFEKFIRNNPYAREKLKDARMETGSLKGWPLPFGSFPGKRGMKNVLLLGDAASFVDPLTGEGIYYALKSGELAAEAVSAGLGRPDETFDTAVQYEKMWRSAFRMRDFMTGYLLQPFMNNSFLVNHAVSRAGKHPGKAGNLAGVVSHVLPKSALITKGL